jgi:predicted SAM-dependent methyltransferase
VNPDWPAPVKLNIGCGNHYAPGWVNIDIDPELLDVTPDVVGDITGRLPWSDGQAHRIYIGHVLEHLALDDVPTALAECKRLLAPGGLLAVVGPDCDRATAMLIEGEISGVEHELVVTGAGRWAHDVHQWYSTGPAVEEALIEAGFAVTAVALVDLSLHWPLTSQIGWQFAFIARHRQETP